MAYTILSPFGQRLFDRLTPWQTEDLARYCDALGAMFDPLLELIQEQGSDGQDGYIPPYGLLADVDLCPAAFLPYLGRFVGVAIPEGATEAEARALIRSEAGQSRGTPAAVRSAIRRSISLIWAADTAYTAGQLVNHEPEPGVVNYCKVITGFTSGSVFTLTDLVLIDIDEQYDLLEREKPNGEEAAWYLTVVVRPEQLSPADDPAALEASINATKPAGIILHVIESDEVLIDEGSLAINEVGEAVIETATLANIT